ncbi:MAG: MFS transporter [Chitinophagales bacterium]|jgi:DHA1 family tetracycline resistance protein-like MFS transporter|nr:MFS transporter [Sphingobacteriales bacterium]
MKKANNSFLLSIFFTAFIDMLGIGIIIPVIPAIFYSEGSSHFAGLVDEKVIRWTFCLLIAAFPFMQFFGAPILGGLSDRYGRKRIIMLSMIGSAVGYSLFSIALYQQSLVILFLSRLIPGFFGGSLSVLFSAISDVSEPADKPKNFAIIGMAFGLGFIFGPMIGGVLSDSSKCSWFNLTTPFLLTIFLALLNFTFVWLTFKETLARSKQTKITFYKGIQNVQKALTTINLRTLFSITFLNTLGFSFYTQFFSVFMFEKFHSNTSEVGYVFAWVGFWLVFTQGFLIRKIKTTISPADVVSKTMLVIGFGIIAMIFPSTIVGILVLNFFLALAQGLNSPNLLTLVSGQAQPEQQGEILGINQSMQSLAQTIPPLVVAVFGKNLTTFPFVFGGSMVVIGWMIFVLLFKRNMKL